MMLPAGPDIIDTVTGKSVLGTHFAREFCPTGQLFPG